MERSEFLKKGAGFLGMALLTPALINRKKHEERGADACDATNVETAGPFPTITPASLVTSNIVGDRTGVGFTINIVVKNLNNACNVQEGLMVDIWHCDKDGNYSEYGGTSMQPTDYTAYHFLRGRQVTDAAGQVTFTSIFPGWYTSRATHIHVHIYSASGASLLITQIAFPEGAGSAVETVNNATAYGYTKGMSGYTYNASDNVFSDGTSTEMSVITGDLSSGYELNWEVFVSSPSGIDELSGENQFQLRQNYPNPCSVSTKIPLVLSVPSDVKMVVAGMDGKTVKTLSLGTMSSGEQIIDMDVSDLAAGRYAFTVKVTNMIGTFRQSKILVKE